MTGASTCANGGYGQVAITIVAILVGFIVISAATIGIGNGRNGRSLEPQPAG